MSEPAAFGIVENGVVVSVRRFQPTEMGIGKDQKAIPLYAESAEEARRQAIEERGKHAPLMDSAGSAGICLEAGMINALGGETE